jgi:hypothetical protein
MPCTAKLDLADGYYRIPLSPSAALRLAVVIPTDVPHLPLVAIPLTLPMGWSQSPPYFCAFMETVTDMANTAVAAHLPVPQHPSYPATQALPVPTANAFTPDAIILGPPHLPPLAYHDVYIDDFLTNVQSPMQEMAMNHLLCAIDKVFDNQPCFPRRAAISSAKLDKGDAVFSTQKRILGWDVDTSTMQLTLPAHRLALLTAALTRFSQLQRTSRHKWRQLLGTLRSATPALYGATHLFSILQHAATKSSGRRIRLTSLVHSVLRDWLHLLQNLHCHPV